MLENIPTIENSSQTKRGSRTRVTPADQGVSEEVTAPTESKGRLASVVAKVLGSMSTWGFVDQGIVSVASFAAAAMVGNYCGSEQLGIYSLAVSTFWLVAGIPNALVWTPYTSRAPKLTGKESWLYAGSALVHLAAVGMLIAGGILLVGLIPWPTLSASDWFLPMCMALAPFTILMLLREHIRRMLLAQMNTPGLLLVDVPIAVLQLTAILLLKNYGQLTFTTALMSMTVPCAWCFAWLLRHRSQFQVSMANAWKDWGTNFQFGRWLLFVSIAWLLGDASFRWLVGSFHGLNELGQFSAAFTTVMFVNPIMLTVQNLARSIFANCLADRGMSGLKQLAFRGTGHLAWIFGLLFAGLALGGGQLVQLFFGSEFVGLGWVVGSLCLGLFLQALAIPVDAALSALRGGEAMLAASLVRLSLILASGAPLIAWYGSIGVGVALAIGSLGAAVLQWNLFLRRFKDAG